MPMFQDIPHSILNLIIGSQFPHPILSPDSARKWLRRRLETETVTVTAAMHLLEYVSADKRMDQLFQLPLFLCKDGQLRSLTLRKAVPNINQFTSKLYIGTGGASELFDVKSNFLYIDDYPLHVASRILDN